VSSFKPWRFETRKRGKNKKKKKKTRLSDFLKFKEKGDTGSFPRKRRLPEKKRSTRGDEPKKKTNNKRGGVGEGFMG